MPVSAPGGVSLGAQPVRLYADGGAFIGFLVYKLGSHAHVTEETFYSMSFSGHLE